MFTLNVGCGLDFESYGNVNCDLILKPTTHRYGKKNINNKLASNFILCDAQYLPFKNSTFDIVISKQVIEHVKNPFLMLKELCRVTKYKVKVETILYFTERLRGSIYKNEAKWAKIHHINKFNQRRLIELGIACGLEFEKGYIDTYWYIPHNYLPLVKLPINIGVVYNKIQ